MRLVDSKEADAWLTRFNANETPFARRLLSSLKLVSHEEFEVAIADELAPIVRARQGRRIALFPIVEPIKNHLRQAVHVPAAFPHATYFQGKAVSVKALAPERAVRVGHY